MKIRIRSGEDFSPSAPRSPAIGSGKAFGSRQVEAKQPRRWPQPQSDEAARLPALAVPVDPVAAPYEALQARLWLGGYGTGADVVVFLGASARCGTSTVAAGFARSLADSPASRVLLIDCERRPFEPALDEQRLSEWSYRFENEERAEPDEVDVNGLLRIGLGAAPVSLLRSGAFDAFLQRARERFDHVVIDAPSIQRHPESLLLARRADAVLLVVHSGVTRTQSAAWARQQLVEARANLVGVVLNRRRFHVPRWLYERL